MPQLTLVQQLISRHPRSAPAQIACVIALIALPTVLRGVLDPWLNDLTWFELHFPTILVGTLLLGWKFGVLIAVTSGVIVTHLLASPNFQPMGPQPIVALLVFLAAAGLIIFTAAGLLAAINHLQEMNRREALLNQELRHRVKNSLAMAQVLASQAARRAKEDPDGFYSDFRGRLSAMAEAHEQLATENWRSCVLPDLALSVLRPFASERLTISGARRIVVPEACLPLTFALHELADNAIKHGALSTPRGRADLSWELVTAKGERWVVLKWRESGGPQVSAPTRRGLGSKLLIRQPGLEHVRLEFAAEGVWCEIAVNLLAEEI